jgi:hypothetical protein
VLFFSTDQRIQNYQDYNNDISDFMQAFSEEITVVLDLQLLKIFNLLIITKEILETVPFAKSFHVFPIFLLTTSDEQNENKVFLNAGRVQVSFISAFTDSQPFQILPLLNLLNSPSILSVLGNRILF